MNHANTSQSVPVMDWADIESLCDTPFSIHECLRRQECDPRGASINRDLISIRQPSLDSGVLRSHELPSSVIGKRRRAAKTMIQYATTRAKRLVMACGLGLVWGLGLAWGLVSPSAWADTTLRITHFLPSVASVQRGVLEPWCADLEERSGHTIHCQIYPAMQLGGIPSQLPDMVRNGVVDIAWTALGYSAGRFPRSEALELPFMLPAGGVTASQIAWDFVQGPARDDFVDYHLLAVHSDGGAIFHSRPRAIHGIDDMVGLKLRAPTRMASRLIDSLGASAVSMPPGQIADTLAKGVIDGASASWEVVPPTKLDEVTHYHTESAPDQATPTVTVLAFLMNKARYEQLPEQAREALDSLSGETLSRRFGRAWDDAIVPVRARLENDPEQTVIALDNATYEAMRNASQSVTDGWVAASADGIDRAALVDSLRAIVDRYVTLRR